jgi:hypothetical protein
LVSIAIMFYLRKDGTINVWKSRDLSSGSWQFVTEAVGEANRVDGTIFRPDGIWNPNTQEVVLWYNWLNAAGQYMGFFKIK